MPEPKHQVTAQCEFFIITELRESRSAVMRGRECLRLHRV